MKTNTLAPDLLQKIHAYWRAANYLSVGQIYLYDNPLLKRPLKLSDVKPLVVGHWGTTPGQNFIYVHLNRVIKKYDLNMFYVAGPGQGPPPQADGRSGQTFRRCARIQSVAAPLGVERTFGWLMHHRRLVRDYARTVSSAEAWVYIAMIRLQLRRLA